MNICAITMVYKDYWALSQWYAHYGRMLGFDNLYIVAHGADAKVASLCPRATVITVPRETLEGFDRRRGQVLNSFADGLAVSFDWVIRTDADELICYDPALYTSLHAVLETASAKSMFALGLNVAETLEDDVLAAGQMALGHRRTAVFSGHYSKAWVTKRGTGLWRHGIWVGPKRIETAVFDLPRGVYLMHLKYANIDALETANQHRTDVGNMPGRGLPGAAWKEAEQTAARFYARLAGFRDETWEVARDHAYATISADPVRDTKENVLRAKSTVFKQRVTLPEWVAATFGDT